MYKSILVPTDGSDLANKAVTEAASLARDGGVKIVIFHAVRPQPQPLYAEGIAVPVSPVSAEEAHRQLENQAKKVLQTARKQLDAARCDVVEDFAISDRPHEAVVEAARKHGCDLIAMASHGYGGFTGLILGSETQKILASCKIPVLVVR